MGSERPLSTIDRSIAIHAPPGRVVAAFFEPAALAVWWHAVRSVTTARPLGVFAVEWATTREVDDLLGRLGGVFHGTVMEYKAGRELFVADAWWLPPDGEPIGPMSLQASCTPEADGCRLRIRQSGYEDSPRWQRYYRIIDEGWKTSMVALKRYVEER
jgi:uncharacterized protein YndB with AHSA1/START domain